MLSSFGANTRMILWVWLQLAPPRLIFFVWSYPTCCVASLRAGPMGCISYNMYTVLLFLRCWSNVNVPIYKWLIINYWLINPHMVSRGVKVPPRLIFWMPFLNRMELTGTLPWLFLNMVWLQNDLYLATLPPPGKSKWRPQSRDFVCFSILTTYKLHISAPIADSNTTVTAAPHFRSPATQRYYSSLYLA